MTSVDVTDNREGLGGIVTINSSMPEIARQASLSEVACRIPHELGGDCDKLATLCSSKRP
jgi:hypothetical protein